MSAASVPERHHLSWYAATGITKHFGGIQALRRVDIELRYGEIHGLVGPNGAGKSTLVKILAGLEQPDSGRLLIDRQPTSLAGSADARRRRLVLMPQELSVLPKASVTDNVTLGSEVSRFGLRHPRACARDARRALELVGLEVDLRTPADQLTVVEQRLVMLARALNTRARLLILDEPTAGLAEAEAELIIAATRSVLSSELSVLYVSHHLSEVARLCDRATCVREGRVVAELEERQLTKDALVNAVLGERDARAVARVPKARRTTASKIELRGVSGRRLRAVSMSAARGEVTGLAGLLGSGVSELIDILTGNVRPIHGEIVVDGTSASIRSPADALTYGIGSLAGDRSRTAFRSLSVRENVSITALGAWCGRSGLLRRGVERRGAAEALAMVSVKTDASLPLGALSGGNQQRALVARLLAADVSVLVFDEPTVGVDIEARAELWASIRRIAERRAVVVASSYPEELAALCDRVICLRNGAVVAELTGEHCTEAEIVHATT
ncbi:MAG: ribose transport system ATP-binding protein [Pseudonocardiales bacterium]|nr:ribose transport system ATP-binding protein [Pseudonocardiales bacterium]